MDRRTGREDWINVRMAKVVARPFCPKCHLFLDEHNNKVCDMRYVPDPEEELCVTSA